jgi:alanyl-tRNA synthetase
MPTRRLFDEDPRAVDFEGRITAIREGEAASGGPSPGSPGMWIALDATAFFPEEGGQRPDSGVIEGHSVAELSIDADGWIWHRLDPDPGWKVGAVVAGRVDPVARRDHTQQHSGQHVLSRAFVEVLGAETRSFHMGEDVSTIDLDAGEGEIPAATIRDVEARANAIVTEDRAVVTSEEPRPNDRPLRSVAITSFDEQHCCGTHVRRTGEIGMIKTLRMERIRSLTRVQFVCGARALRAFQEAIESVDAASRVLSTGWNDLPSVVARIMEGERETLRRARDWQGRWAILEAERLVRETERSVDGILRIAAWIDGADAESLRAAANAITSKGRAIAILAGPGEEGKRPWIVAGSEDLPGDFDAREKLKEILQPLGGRGGGSKFFAQGSAPADEDAARARVASLRP